MKDMKKLIITLAAFLLIWGGWYICFPYFMVWMEGSSFFTALPDFLPIQYELPGDLFNYMASFLLKFFAYPASGAAVQAAVPVFVTICVWLIVKRLFKDSEGLFWLSFLAVPAVVYLQLTDITLVKVCVMLTVVVAVTLAVLIFTCFARISAKLPKFLKFKWLIYAVPALSVILSIYLLHAGPLTRQHEAIARLAYMGEHEDWDGILKSVSRQDALSNGFMRRYVLLALSETDRLPDYAFRYGLSGADDFVIKQQDGPLAMKFNILFYRALGLQNPVIYYAYQQALQSSPGLSFDAMRTLTDAYLGLKDHDLAARYVDILDRSSFNRKWVRDRKGKLEAIRDAEPEYPMTGSRFLFKDFYNDITALAARYPDNKKYADYLLCGLLADKSGNRFFSVFDMVAGTHYKDTRTMPLLYQEALCLIAGYEPEVLEKYPVDERIIARFDDFSKLVRSGKVSQAKRKYADTYWAYVY